MSNRRKVAALESRSSRTMALSTGKAGVRYRQEALEAFYEGFKSRDRFCGVLPDSMLDGIEQLMIERGGIDTYQCSREDEGVAMAMGAFLVGKRPVALMEGSGIGLSALILARGIVQKTPTMLIIGHNSTSGSATIITARPAWWRSRFSARSTFPTMFFSIPRISGTSSSRRKQPSKASACRSAS